MRRQKLALVGLFIWLCFLAVTSLLCKNTRDQSKALSETIERLEEYKDELREMIKRMEANNEQIR